MLTLQSLGTSTVTLLLGAADYPVAVQTGGIKRAIMVFLIIASALALIAVFTWRTLALVIDMATSRRWRLVQTIETSDPSVIRDRWRRWVVSVAILISVTILTGLFLPPIGASTIRFKDIVNSYEIKSFTFDDPSRVDELTSNGDGIRVPSDELRSGSWRVKWLPSEGRSMVVDGEIQLSNGRVRLMSDQGTSPALKKAHFDF